MRIILIGIYLVVVGVGVAAEELGLYKPCEVRECVSSLEEDVTVLEEPNPFYHRGDFDGDHKPDVVVAVTWPR